MYGLSNKDVINRPTSLARVDNHSIFMSVQNQIDIIKQIYIMYKNNGGNPQYLYFRETVPNDMFIWAVKKNINNYEELFKTNNMLEYINSNFIKDYVSYEDPWKKTRDSNNVNVFRSKYNISTYNNGRLHTNTVRSQDLTVQDIQNLDVWSKQTVTISNDRQRYNNAIPIWQKSMHKRNYDRNNEGLTHSIKNSSWEHKPSGDKNAMSALYKMADARLKKSSNIDRYY